MALQGTLETFALPDVLRLLASTKKTGCYRLDGDRGSGRLWVREGKVIAGDIAGAPATTDPLEVAFELLRFTNGEFVFQSEKVAAGEHDGTDVEGVLAGAENMMGEWKEIESIVPSLQHWVSLRAELPADEVTIRADKWVSVVAIGSGCTVGQLGVVLGLGELPVSRIVRDLFELGVVELHETTEAPSARGYGVPGAYEPAVAEPAAYGQSYEAQGYDRAAYETPAHEATYEQAAYDAAAYERGEYQQPTYEGYERGYEEPAAYEHGQEAHTFDPQRYEAPGYEAAGYEGQNYEAQGYEPAAYEPGYDEHYAAQGYETQGHETQGYEQPQAQEAAYGQQRPYEVPGYGQPGYEDEYEYESPMAALDPNGGYRRDDYATEANVIEFSPYGEQEHQQGYDTGVQHPEYGRYDAQAPSRTPDPASDPTDAAEIARQLANLSPRAAKAVAAAAKATTQEEREAALAQVDETQDAIDRELLLRFLGSVNS